MAHLTCTWHNKRVMVLENGTAVHRATNDVCGTNNVRINNFAYAKDVLPDVPLSRKTVETIDLTRHVPNVELFQAGMKKFGKAFKNMAEVMAAASPAARLLHDIFTVDPDLSLVKCPVCNNDAVKDKSQENTIYCDMCDYIGMEADAIRTQREGDDDAYRQHLRNIGKITAVRTTDEGVEIDFTLDED